MTVVNNRTETNPAITPRLQSETYWRGVVYPTRWAQWSTLSRQLTGRIQTRLIETFMKLRRPPAMSSHRVACLPVAWSLLLGAVLSVHAEDVIVQVGVSDSVHSTRLNENRALIVYLPPGHESSGHSYPVLYLLDGNRDAMLEALAATGSLERNKFMPEIIVVGIANVDRDRDMMPLSTKQYTVPKPGAEAFLGFIGDELVPYIDQKYRTRGPRLLCGKSLSGLFVLYAFLTKPALFDAYIGRSAGWLGDMNDYFTGLTERAFQRPQDYEGKAVFMSNSLMDIYDPDKVVHRQMLVFSDRVRKQLGDAVRYQYATYDSYPHVPYPSLYDGLKFVFQSPVKK